MENKEFRFLPVLETLKYLIANGYPKLKGITIGHFVIEGTTVFSFDDIKKFVVSTRGEQYFRTFECHVTQYIVIDPIFVDDYNKSKFLQTIQD